MTAGRPDTPHFPGVAAIEAYGNGGFRFANMSHRGSLLCFPNGIWAWDVMTPEAISADTLAGVFAQAGAIDTLVLGTGVDVWIAPPELRARLRSVGIVLDVMQTGPALRIYNVMAGEGRRVAAALIAVP